MRITKTHAIIYAAQLWIMNNHPSFLPTVYYLTKKGESRFIPWGEIQYKAMAYANLMRRDIEEIYERWPGLLARWIQARIFIEEGRINHSLRVISS